MGRALRSVAFDPSWKPGILPCAAVATLCIAFVLLTAPFRNGKGVTVDETFYLNSGMRVFREHNFSWLEAAGTAALPILAVQWVNAVSTDSPAVSPGQEWQSQRGDLSLVRRARLTHVLLVGIPLLLIVFGWLYSRRGLFCAVVGAALIALSPGILAHAGLATTDVAMCVSTLILLSTLSAYRDKPSVRRLLALGATLGLALATKYSAVLFVPCIGILMLEIEWRENASSKRPFLAAVGHSFQKMVYIGLVAHVVSSVLGGFNLSFVTQGILLQYFHNQIGQPAFLCGLTSQYGWPYYFPAAFLLKSTPTELLVVIAFPILLLLYVVRRRKDPNRDSASLVWLLAGCLYGLLVLTSHINIGVRYILPVHVLFLVWTVDQLGSYLPKRRKLIVSAGLVLVGIQAMSAYQAAPHYLSYFNPIVGGSSQGYRYLSDSNLDWGQDLPLFSRELEHLPYDRILLCYFGTDRPEHYAINSRKLPDISKTDPSRFDAVAVSATALSGSYSDTFRPFFDIQPSARVGHSILIYDLKSPLAAAAMREAMARQADTPHNSPLITTWMITKCETTP